MLYHYTSFDALKNILRYAKSQEQMCFWATRYDCFADTDEFKLGVETIRRLLPEMEKELQPDRQIAPLFDWNEIKDNKNLPYPYIVSFTSRTDNDYMWKKYAKTDGVVMAIDDTQYVPVPDAPMIRLVSCIYTDDKSDDKLVDMLHKEYTNIGYGLLGGPQKNMAFRLLKGYPQFFVKLIAMGLLSLAAPRFKGAKDYWMEEETRAIIPIPVSDYQSLIKGYGDEMIKLGLSPAEISKIVANEYVRQRDDGSTVYYREMHLTVDLLKGVYVRNTETKKKIEIFLRNMGLTVPVRQV